MGRRARGHWPGADQGGGAAAREARAAPGRVGLGRRQQHQQQHHRHHQRPEQRGLPRPPHRLYREPRPRVAYVAFLSSITPFARASSPLFVSTQLWRWSRPRPRRPDRPWARRSAACGRRPSPSCSRACRPRSAPDGHRPSPASTWRIRASTSTSNRPDHSTTLFYLQFCSPTPTSRACTRCIFPSTRSTLTFNQPLDCLFIYIYLFQPYLFSIQFEQ